jgi:hypothetical protein
MHILIFKLKAFLLLIFYGVPKYRILNILANSTVSHLRHNEYQHIVIHQGFRQYY